MGFLQELSPSGFTMEGDIKMAQNAIENVKALYGNGNLRIFGADWGASAWLADFTDSYLICDIGVVPFETDTENLGLELKQWKDIWGVNGHFSTRLDIPTHTPASQGAAGVVGQLCYDADYLYVCTATNHWERVAIAAWQENKKMGYVIELTPAGFTMSGMIKMAQHSLENIRAVYGDPVFADVLFYGSDWVGNHWVANFEWNYLIMHAGIIPVTTNNDNMGTTLKKWKDVWGVDGHFSTRLDIPTHTPASQGAAGVVGQVCYDANYIYVCTATNYWERASISWGAPALTVADFQANAATGTFILDPQKINDNNTGNYGAGNVNGQYAEVDLGSTFKAKQSRQFGHISNSGSVFKVEYYDGSWHDWVTGVNARNTANWSNWSDIGEQEMSKIRITVTTPTVYLPEIEFKF